MIIGSHVSFKKDTQLIGSIKEALSYGANTFMFYTGAPQNTIRYDIKEDLLIKAHEMLKENNIDINNIIVHAPYIINMASSNDFAPTFLKQEINRVEALGMKYLVLHPGNSVKLSTSEAIKNIIDNLIPNREEFISIYKQMLVKKELNIELIELKKIFNILPLKIFVILKIFKELDLLKFDINYNENIINIKLLEKPDKKLNLNESAILNNMKQLKQEYAKSY